MANRSDEPAPHVESVDQIFSWLAEAVHTGHVPREAVQPPQAPGTAAPAPASVPPSSPIAPFAPAPRQADLQAEHRWLQEERKRLEAYTLSQFALIKQQREELLTRKTQIEEALALREQELNRQMKILAESNEALQKRGKETAEREAVLSEQLEQINNAQQTLQTLQQTSARMQKEIEAQRGQLEQTRIQSAHLQE